MENTGYCSATLNGAESNSPLTLSSVTQNAAWIVQGVTPQQDRGRMSDDGDGVWYSRTANEYLHESINKWDTPLDEIMTECIYTLSDLYATSVEAPMELDPRTLPSAMISCIRYNERTGDIEYFNLGDAVILVEQDNNPYRVCATDASLSDPQFTVDDQWRLSFQPEAINYARHGTLSDNEVDNLYLFPTAVDATVEVYGLYDSTEAFIEEINTKGVEAVVSEIADSYATLNETVTRSDRPGVRDISLITVRFGEIRE